MATVGSIPLDEVLDRIAEGAGAESTCIRSLCGKYADLDAQLTSMAIGFRTRRPDG